MDFMMKMFRSISNVVALIFGLGNADRGKRWIVALITYLLTQT